MGKKVSPILSLGRILAEDILADRDLPPFDRPTVDGIAIDFTAYEEGLRSFNIKAIQSAGEASVPIDSQTECIEIMTGAALDNTLNAVIRYEDMTIENGIAHLNIEIKRGRTYTLKEKIKAQAKFWLRLIR